MQSVLAEAAARCFRRRFAIAPALGSRQKRSGSTHAAQERRRVIAQGESEESLMALSRMAFTGGTLGPVASVGPAATNAFGLFDMHGNASEWCSDVFEIDHGFEVASPSGLLRPDDAHVVRGGDARGRDVDVRSASRFPSLSPGRLTGFRPAATIPLE